MELNLHQNSLIVYKALSSESRLHILNLLAEAPRTASQLAEQTGLSKAIISRHISMLSDAKLIRTVSDSSIADQRKKLLALAVDEIRITMPQQIFPPFHKQTTEICLGYFSDFHVVPTCGLASKDHLIGEMDDPRSFVLNERVKASLLWFSDGYIEYVVPNTLETGQTPELLELSLELSSEFPGSNNNWPSDIFFQINGVTAAVWTCPGNYSDVRGVLTPSWWDNGYSQYGILKHLRVSRTNTGLDGKKYSDVVLKDLHLEESPFIHIRIGVDKESTNRGGLTLFGSQFGNHPQNILLSLYYSDEKRNR